MSKFDCATAVLEISKEISRFALDDLAEVTTSSDVDSVSVDGLSSGPVSIMVRSRLVSIMTGCLKGLGGTSHIPSASHNTRNSGGFMLRLGQNTSKRLLKGILVSLLRFAVALIRSVTVCNKSRFSWGSPAMSDLRAFTRDSEGARMPEKLGMASVDSDGGLRMAGTFPPVFESGPLIPRAVWGVPWDSRLWLSAERTASKYGISACVNIGSGTRINALFRCHTSETR